MNDRFRMMLRAQCTYSNYKRLMHNRRIVWLRSYFSGTWARQFEETVKGAFQPIQNGCYPYPLEDIVIPLEFEIRNGEKS